VTPEINAISTVIICVSLALLFTSRSLQNRRPAFRSRTMRDQLYINGEWVSPDLGGYLEIDPATEQVFHRVAAGTEEDVDHAVRAPGAPSTMAGAKPAAPSARSGWRPWPMNWKVASPRWRNWRCATTANPCPKAQWDIGDAIGWFCYYAGLARELDERQDQPLALPDARFRCRIRHEPIAWPGRSSRELPAADGRLERERPWRRAPRWC
jgi:betaine-aldehyde dehydrogenase